jgi:hypothetical protein
MNHHSPIMVFVHLNQPLRPGSNFMKISPHTKAILTDSHFLVPLIVFCIGLALLITLH